MSAKEGSKGSLPKYVPEVMRKLRWSRPKKGQIQHITIYHDDWCAQLLGLGACDCNPTVGEPILEE
jgi:hypothetical protein